MNEFSSEEKLQLAKRRETIGKLIDKNICENMKIYIFGETKTQRIVKSVGNYPMYINNILSLAFVFAHGCLRRDNDGPPAPRSSSGKKATKKVKEYVPKSASATKQSSMRIINSLRKAYVQYPVTSELIQFVLSDIQFEMLQGPTAELYELFENLCDFPTKDGKTFSLTPYYKLIATWRAAPSRFNMNSNELAGMFLQLLKNMKFLKNYELVDDNGSFTFVDKDTLELEEEEKYSYIPASHLLYYNPSLSFDMYSLYSVERKEENDVKTLGLQYVTEGGFKTMAITVCEEEPEDEALKEYHVCEDAEDYYYEIIGEEWDFDEEEKTSKKNANYIDQVHAINYKYIKNLALSISDAISVNLGSKKALYDTYHLRHKDVFDKITSSADIDSLPIDWDGVIVMLLIESSPTSVLETLFRAVKQNFLTIANNLCKRIDNPDMPIYGLDDNALLKKRDEIIRTKLIMGETGGFGRISRVRSDDRLRARAEALLIISSLSAVLEDENVEKAICAGNIYDNITLLQKMRGEEDAEHRCKYVTIILSETFRHLLCFYKGLMAYGGIKGEFDGESCNSCFTEQKIASYQRRMHTAFMEAAKAEADELKSYNPAEYKDMLELLHRFIRMCEYCTSTVSNATRGGRDDNAGRNLFHAIGKHDILNVAEFKSFALGHIENLPEISAETVDAWIPFALDILRYLRIGRKKKNGDTSAGADSPLGAIYPFTAVYNRGNENYDGYKTVTFALNINPEGEEERKEYINVLTEFSYNLSNVFYCLPNVLRSNRKWWIDPVLIDFKTFNEIFEVEAE